MAAPNVTLDGDELTVEITKGNKQWVARLDGEDDQYGYDRNFVSPYGRGTERTAVETGAVIEMCYHSHSGREKGRRYWVVVAGELVEIEESEVNRVLGATVVRIDGDSEPESHECEVCGDEFDSAHGLAVHAGMVHSDDAREDEPSAEADGGAEQLVTDGGIGAGGGDDDIEWIDDGDFAELALEYRDEMLKSLSAIGVEHASSYSAPGEEIRRLPVETTGAHDGAGNTVGTHRVLTDVRGYDDPEHEIPSDDAVHYLTVRETTGYAAIQSSATMALGWSTIPTPREIRLAEHLNDLTESDVSPHHHRINRARAAEEIIEQVYPRDSRYDDADLWLRPEETSIGNTVAVDECVAALRYGEWDDDNHIVRFRDDYADSEADGPLDYRLSTPRGLIVDKFFDNPRGEYGSETWYQVYSGLKTTEVDADVEALGYVSADGDQDDKGIETHVVTIPEMRKPEDVLDLPAPEPRAPPEGENNNE
jgi:hypothetical protein